MPKGNGVAPNNWHAARLIPTVGIRGQEEQEKRATSSLLAVMHAVPDFGHALLKQVGAPKGRITTYCEVQIKDAAGKTHIPDGAIVVERGAKSWRCLVEVKTGAAALESDQVNRYLDLARADGFDAVVTISNQISGSPTSSPVAVDRRKLRTVGLYHLSWWRIITESVLEHRHRGVTDPDQAWILSELISYLDDERSGASGFQDMGESWVTVRSGAAEGTLRVNDKPVKDVAERWRQFVEYLCLGLSQDLGRDIRPVRPRKATPATTAEGNARELAAAGRLHAAIRVPDAVGPLTVEADLRTRRVTTSVVIDAPGDGRASTRINWMLRQLRNAPDSLLVEVAFTNAKETQAALLSAAREDPGRLCSSTDAKRSPRSFRLALSRPMGTKRGKGEKSFVRETRKQTMDFYRELVQELRPWRASPPKLPLETAAHGPVPVVEPTPPTVPHAVQYPRMPDLARTAPDA